MRECSVEVLVVARVQEVQEAQEVRVAEWPAVGMAAVQLREVRQASAQWHPHQDSNFQIACPLSQGQG